MFPSGFLPITVADHVVLEDGRAHAGENGAADLAGVLEASTVSVGAEDGSEGVEFFGRAEKAAGDVESGGAFEGDLLDGVSVVGALFIELGIERSSFRERGQLGSSEDARFELGFAFLPLGESGILGLKIFEFFGCCFWFFGLPDTEFGFLGLKNEDGEEKDSKKHGSIPRWQPE